MTGPMRVLVGCEIFGEVRDAFLALGHDAWSCDLLPAERPSNRHIVGDIRDVLHLGWDLAIIAHPPCTRLCNSGVRWLHEPPTNPPAEVSDVERASWMFLSRDQKLAIIWRLLDEGADLFSECWNAPVQRVAVENPIMHRYARERIRGFRPQDQVIQPWMFGHGETKGTCLWLRGLPRLVPTRIVDGRVARVHRASPGRNRWKERSRTYPGIAAAMAEQWGGRCS